LESRFFGGFGIKTLGIVFKTLPLCGSFFKTLG